MPPGIGYPPPQFQRPGMAPLRGLNRPLAGGGRPNMVPPTPPLSTMEKIAQFLSQPGLRDALLATGSSLMAQSDQPGSLGGALGRALPAGVQAYQMGQQQADVDKLIEGAPREMRRFLRAMDRDRVVPTLLSMQQPPDPVQLGANERLVDPGTGEELVGAVPEQEEPSSMLRNFSAWLQMTPEQQAAFGSFMETQRAPGTTVNVGGEPSLADKALVDIEAGELQESVEAARRARGQLSTLREVENLLEAGVETGAEAEMLLPARELATAFGVGDADRLIRQQNFRALSNEIAIGMTQGLEGQISERELDFVRAAVPNIGLTPEANRRIVEIGKNLNDTVIKVAEAQREYFRENGTLQGFESIRRRIVEDNLLNSLPEPGGMPEPGSSPFDSVIPPER